MNIFVAVVLIVVFSAAWLLTGLFRRFAVAWQLVDIPNARSSHTSPAPRGGGAAIVVSSLAGVLVLASFGELRPPAIWGFVGAGLIVAIVGFIDDLDHVQPRWRLLGHFTAALLIASQVGLLPIAVIGNGLALRWLAYAVTIIYVAWLINLTNFMDGIDGLAAAESITVCLGSALLYVLAMPSNTLWIAPLVLVAATSGFLVWNWPPARIFMGDTGSGFLGLAFASLSIVAGRTAPAFFCCWIILLGVFIVDATTTLLRRLTRGERIYEAHRTHAYQHAAQRFGHLRVTLSVTAINTCWLFPIALLVGKGMINPAVGILSAYTPLVAAAIWMRTGEATNH